MKANRMSVLGHIKSVVVLCLVLAMVVGPAHGADTMLMFVGEDLEVLTIASRREEAAWSAPAIASVITRSDIEAKGASTIAEALEDMPGFYINQNEKGVVPYLRGIQNSALFLYDTVPMNTGVRKSDAAIGYDTSLAAVKRLEVVRGTGSVLWGPDAFAGMVNAVPYTGREFQGVETGLVLSTLDDPGEAYVNWGLDKRGWSSFFSVSGRMTKNDGDDFNVVRFWNGHQSPDPPEPLESRYGTGHPDDSRYINLYGNLTLGDWLTVSVKLGDIQKAYAVNDWNNTYSWEEQEAVQSQTFKLEASKALGPDTGIRFTGFYSRNMVDHTIVDYTYDQKESSVYGELILDQSLLNVKGLATLGASFRRNTYDDIPVWQSFLPDYFKKENLVVLPEMNQKSFGNQLVSVFGQYRHDLTFLELWAGARYDSHDKYRDATSYNAGLAWNLGRFKLKGIHGTAFRTPFPQQIQSSGSTRLEKIRNTSAQLSWKDTGTRASMTLFTNKISNHVIEDRYLGAGLSTPNNQEIRGVELEVEHQVTDRLRLAGNLTFLENSGPNETYYYRDYIYEGAAGNTIVYYKALDYAYETGPDTTAAVWAVWDIFDHVRVVPKLRYFSGQSLYSPLENSIQTCGSAWITDLHLTMTHYFPFDLSFHVNNLFDTGYTAPGLYSVTQGPGISASMAIRMKW